MDRRHFLNTAATGAAALASAAALPNVLAADTAQWPIAIFEKVFEGLSYEELADAIHKIGAEGVEATIRPGGHIAPEVAEDEVPKMAEALAKHDKKILIAATGIKQADASSEKQLRILKQAGVTHYRMSHYHYDLAKPILPQLRDYTHMARGLAALNQEIGIQGLYQNHSGENSRRGYLGALGLDAAMMLAEINPDHIGIAFDTRHLRKDTGSSWETAAAALRPHVRSIYVKDGIWHGERGDQYKDVPLDEGFVNQGVFNTMRQGLAPMPLCIHMEWLGYRIFPKAEIPDAIAANRRDVQTLRNWLTN